MTLVRERAAEAPAIDTVHKAVFHFTDRMRFWLETPEEARWPKVWVPEAVAAVIDEEHCKLFFTLPAFTDYVSKNGIGRLDLRVIYGP